MPDGAAARDRLTWALGALAVAGVLAETVVLLSEVAPVSPDGFLPQRALIFPQSDLDAFAIAMLAGPGVLYRAVLWADTGLALMIAAWAWRAVPPRFRWGALVYLATDWAENALIFNAVGWTLRPGGWVLYPPLYDDGIALAAWAGLLKLGVILGLIAVAAAERRGA